MDATEQVATLSAADDHLIHRTPDPVTAAFPRPAARDPRFFERYWKVLHDETGDLMVALGGSFYPNLGRAEAYAIVNHRGHHRSVRAFRPLGSDRSDLTVGPIQPTIIDGLARWRHSLEEGPWGFSYDLTWTDSYRQVYGAAWGPEPDPAAPAGTERHVTAGFEGFGAVTGWVQVGDHRIAWPAGTARGTRDRHWGIGRGVGGPAMNGGRAVRAGWKGGMWIDFGDVAVWGKRVLYRPQDPRPGAGRIVGVDRRMRFEDDSRIFTEARIDLTFDDGEHRLLHLERLGAQTAYMRCGFYGGTPSTGLHHGEYDGPATVEWDAFDTTDPAVRRSLSGLNEHHCRVRWDGRETTGILQPLEPDAYDACVAGTPGWRLF